MQNCTDIQLAKCTSHFNLTLFIIKRLQIYQGLVLNGLKCGTIFKLKPYGCVGTEQRKYKSIFMLENFYHKKKNYFENFRVKILPVVLGSVPNSTKTSFIHNFGQDKNN
jgi:hypothetical protein